MRGFISVVHIPCSRDHDSDDTNEGTVFTPSGVSSPTDMSTFLENNFPALATSDANTINELYPKGAQFSGRGEFFSAAAAAYGEMRYICPGILVSTSIAEFQAPKPTWNYQYVFIVSIRAYLILQQL